MKQQEEDETGCWYKRENDQLLAGRFLRLKGSRGRAEAAAKPALSFRINPMFAGEKACWSRKETEQAETTRHHPTQLHTPTAAARLLLQETWPGSAPGGPWTRGHLAPPPAVEAICQLGRRGGARKYMRLANHTDKTRFTHTCIMSRQVQSIHPSRGQVAGQQSEKGRPDPQNMLLLFSCTLRFDSDALIPHIFKAMTPPCEDFSDLLETLWEADCSSEGTGHTSQTWNTCEGCTQKGRVDVGRGWVVLICPWASASMRTWMMNFPSRHPCEWEDT